MNNDGRIERKDRYVCKSTMTCNGAEYDGYFLHRTDYFSDGSECSMFFFELEEADFWKLMEGQSYKWSNDEEGWVKLTADPVPPAIDIV